jgi:hypothetical protein
MLRLLRSPWLWGSALVVALTFGALWRFNACPRGNLARLDPAAPYRIALGRGSGWHGLNTIDVRSDGTVTLHRQCRQWDGTAWRLCWETATLHLPDEGLAKVLDAVEGDRVLGLCRAYSANVADGEQWVLWVRQGEREQVVYCDNNFPHLLVRFAAHLDAILAENGLPQAEWHRVEPASRDHERELWDSIKR